MIKYGSFEKRRLPEYATMRHTPSPYGSHNDFGFDFATPSRGRYKERDGIRVYETGYTEVRAYVHRDPHARWRMERDYGLVFARPSECRGIKFFAPPNDYYPGGQEVPKSWLEGQTDMLFLDAQAMRAYSFAPKWATIPEEDRLISFAHRDAVPVAHCSIRAKVPDIKAVDRVMRENKELFLVAQTTRAALGAPSVGLRRNQVVSFEQRLTQTLRCLLTGQPLGDMTPERLAALGDYSLPAIKSLLRQLSTSVQTLPWLRIQITG